MPKRTLVTHLINDLSPKYDHIAMIIRDKDPLPTFLQARSNLIFDEQCLNRQRLQQSAHSDYPFSPTVLYNNTNLNNTSYSHGGHHSRGGRSKHNILIVKLKLITEINVSATSLFKV